MIYDTTGVWCDIDRRVWKSLKSKDIIQPRYVNTNVKNIHIHFVKKK
jgi:hypothetical protein